jgi:hypothetical protein
MGNSVLSDEKTKTDVGAQLIYILSDGHTIFEEAETGAAS